MQFNDFQPKGVLLATTCSELVNALLDGKVAGVVDVSRATSTKLGKSWLFNMSRDPVLSNGQKSVST